MDNYNVDKSNSAPEYNPEPSVPDYSPEEEPQKNGNIPLAVIAGIISSVIVANVWAAICINAEKQWIWMGIIAGIVVGWCVRIVSGGNNTTIGLIGASFAFLSCFMGDFFTNLGFIAQQEGVGFFDALTMFDYSTLFEVQFADFGIFSVIVYGIAAIKGYTFGMGKNADLEE